MENKRSIIFKLLNKITALSLIASICFPSLAAPLQTYAMFVSSAESSGNRFITGELSIEAATTAASFVPEAVKTGETAYRSIAVSNDGTLPFSYVASVEKIDGNAGACESLRLVARRNDTLVYDGNLLENATSTKFSASWELAAASEADQWQFEAYFPKTASNIPYDGQCSFKFIFFARQILFNDPRFGFSAKAEVVNNLYLNRAAVPNVDVIYPDGGQLWYVVAPQCPANPDCSKWCTERKPDAMNANCQYNIRWTAHNPYGPDSDLLIDIYYSNDSGRHWLPKINPVPLPNTGSYLWMLPYDTAYVTHTARIKVVAYGKNNAAFVGEAVSERDFCPPMMSMEDLMNQIAAEEEASNAGRASAAPQAVSDAALPPSDIAPMPPQDVVEAIDIIRNATSTETTGDSALLDPGLAIEIMPFAAPGSGNSSQAVEAITGPPAIIPQQSNEENATSTDTE